MRIKTGWYDGDYYVVKPLNNGCRQQLVMFAQREPFGRWNIATGVFSCNATYHSLHNSEVWGTPTSTNKNPSFKVVTLALEALSEIEQVLSEIANGKRYFIYIDGEDERRLRVYTKILTKSQYGYKKSTAQSYWCRLPQLYKAI